MPFYDYEEEPFPAPPAPAPPPPGPGTIGPAGPPITGGPPVVEEPPVGPGGGGGGGAPAPVLPGLPAFNIPGAPVFKPNPFNRPTMETAMNEPGYQFRLQSGSDALERSAAAAGRLRTGGTLSDILEYGQNFGAQEYDRVFNRELANYDRYYRSAHDAYAPEFARWQLGAQGLRDATGARYNAELNNFLQQNAPRPSGPSFNPEDFLGPALPPPPAYPGKGPGIPGYPGGDDPYMDQGFSAGDPWTDPWTGY